MLTQGFTVCLSSLELLKPGEEGIVTRFRNAEEITIDKLVAMGIKPGTAIMVERRSPDFIITAKNNRWQLDKAMTRAICVRLIPIQ